MSHVQHKSMSVTSFNKKMLKKCRKKFKQIGLDVTKIYDSQVNGYHNFFVIPRGSKAGWPEEANYLECLNNAEEIIKGFAYEDNSNCLEYTISTYGQNEG